MGITDFSIVLINKVLDKYPEIKSVCELGDQQTYIWDIRYGQHANWLYEQKGISYFCVDINGKNNAWQIDLSKPQKINIQYDLVTDFGTSEHISDNGAFGWEAIYNCWKTKHDLLKVDGIMINENPKSKNWPFHGQNYYIPEFYEELCQISGYDLLEVGQHPAMGNDVDGWNVYAIIRKTSEEFPSLEEFKKLSIKES